MHYFCNNHWELALKNRNIIQKTDHQQENEIRNKSRVKKSFPKNHFFIHSQVGREIGNPVLKFKNGKFSSELFATLSFVSLSVELPLSDDVSEPEN